MELYGVRVQPITDDTSPTSVEEYGEVIDINALMEDDIKGRDFCDGQTSALPPKYADDNAGMIYTYDRRTAETFSEVLRLDVASRVSAGQLVAAPAWLSNVTAGSILSTEALPEAVNRLREIRQIDDAITDSQIENQIRSYVVATGKPSPALDELWEWMGEHAAWIAEYL